MRWSPIRCLSQKMHLRKLGLSEAKLKVKINFISAWDWRRKWPWCWFPFHCNWAKEPFARHLAKFSLSEVTLMESYKYKEQKGLALISSPSLVDFWFLPIFNDGFLASFSNLLRDFVQFQQQEAIKGFDFYKGCHEEWRWINLSRWVIHRYDAVSSRKNGKNSVHRCVCKVA